MKNKKIHNLNLYNGDCMDYMKNVPDKYFDLAIVDPPYGIDAANKITGPQRKSGNGVAQKTGFDKKDWDKTPPNKEYFIELLRVSKNQIIWGANHFCGLFDSSSPCWIVWDKNNGSTNFADCELAYTSFNTAVRKFTYTWNGMLQGDMKKKEFRIHPTQKPVKLYEWLLKNYSKPGYKILDTHLGSGSNAIACHYFGSSEFVGIELDEHYYKESIKRIQQETKQIDIFRG